MKIANQPIPVFQPANCALCGSSAIRLDEVDHFGRMQLGECDRCEHRWTQRIEVAARLPMIRVAAIAKIASAA